MRRAADHDVRHLASEEDAQHLVVEVVAELRHGIPRRSVSGHDLRAVDERKPQRVREPSELLDDQVTELVPGRAEACQALLLLGARARGDAEALRVHLDESPVAEALRAARTDLLEPAPRRERGVPAEEKVPGDHDLRHREAPELRQHALQRSQVTVDVGEKRHRLRGRG